MTKQLTLNCDMGESFGIYRIGADDEQMLELVTSANIACMSPEQASRKWWALA